jgi:sugar O-acyltransferase (sialic acid O-acetyltransferase NeuD family)
MAGKDTIILVGGGGHCRACIDVIELENRFKIAGIVDVSEKLHQTVSGYETIACDEDLPQLVNKHHFFLITLGQIKDAKKRINRFQYLKELGAKLAVVISPLAYVSKTAVVGVGTIIMHRAVVNTGAYIGRNCIINTGAIVEHDTKVSDNCHISTGSIVNGGCFIGEGVFIGSKSVLANNLSVAEYSIIGAGTVVVKSLDRKGCYVGSPARLVK